MAENNDKPLIEKLGIEEGMTVSILNAPNYFHFDLGDLPDGVDVHADADNTPADIFLVFCARSPEAERGFERAVTYLPPDGAIWMAWPKETSNEDTDITEDTLRDLFLPTGMVDDGTHSLDETWSGLRFVVPEERREDWPPDLPAQEATE